MATTEPSIGSSSKEITNYLKDVFKLIIKQRIVDIEITDIYRYLKIEYDTDLLQLNNELAPMVPFLIVNFIKNWNGFKLKQKFIQKQDEFYEIFHTDVNRFIRNLLDFWRNDLIKNPYTIKYHFEKHNCQGQIKVHGKEEEKDGCINLINISEDFAPFKVLIKCPPSQLNTIFFTSYDDDVLLKQHASFPWKSLTVEELIHWPFVEVVFKNCDLIIRRRQASEYLCHINFVPDEKLIINNDLIEYAKLCDETIERKCYTSNLLRKYFRELLDLLKFKKLLTRERREEIDTIFNHFILDIRDLNINNSMATNTNVLFKLGKSQYIRNKKLGNTSTEKKPDGEDITVGYCELLLPKIELEMTKFDSYVIRDNGPGYFKTIQRIKGYNNANIININLLNQILPEITYKCTFCNQRFIGEQSKSLILSHFQRSHKMEQPIRCIKCKIQFDFPSLAKTRWEHECILANEKA